MAQDSLRLQCRGSRFARRRFTEIDGQSLRSLCWCRSRRFLRSRRCLHRCSWTFLDFQFIRAWLLLTMSWFDSPLHRLDSTELASLLPSHHTLMADSRALILFPGDINTLDHGFLHRGTLVFSSPTFPGSIHNLCILCPAGVLTPSLFRRSYPFLAAPLLDRRGKFLFWQRLSSRLGLLHSSPLSKSWTRHRVRMSMSSVLALTCWLL